jgi:hypothetical protein
MSRYEGIHVSLQSQLSVYTFLVKFNLDEVIRVSPYYEIYLGPVYHYHLFKIVNYIWKLLLGDSLQTLVLKRRLEVSV